ncbi:DUF6796 family protein [Caulobacter sp. 17J80-11]|uniref:DUF6796 family protein n=1 Tax=Caulobacter sp. 17J80-11 TaxID=2763502 RepID=UPI001653A2E8|nr:DUF6796 family protein [Caulobacter sp. 17J80-11]MBC6982250.1 hypothetical protein [Caulobacter sp. 17J80-11]
MTVFERAPGPRTILLTGLCGLAGALLLFAGDMLFFGRFGSGAEAVLAETTARASTARLIIGGAVAPFAGLGYLIGCAHLFWRLAPAPAWARAGVTLGAALLFLAGACVHAAWGAYALAIRAAATEPALAPLRDTIGGYTDVLFALAYAAGYPAAVVLFVLVAAGRTSWPRWTALVNPVLVKPLLETAGWIPAPLGAVLVGGGFNLAMAVFFAVSIATCGRRLTRL